MKAKATIALTIVLGLLLTSALVVAAETVGLSISSLPTYVNPRSRGSEIDDGVLAIDQKEAQASISSGTLGWEQVNTSGFGYTSSSVVTSLAVFSDTLYASSRNWGTGAHLWHTTTGISWTAVFTDGFGSSSNQGIDHMIEFKGNLYAGTWANTTAGGEVWRSGNGLEWTRVISQGFGNTANVEIFRFAVFSDTLYASVWNRPNGGTIWYSDNGDADNWYNANVPWDANNIAATAFDVFNNYLYAGTNNETTGGEMWSTSNGTTWNQVNSDGFGDPTNDAIASFAIFNGYLYAGTRNANNGGQIWRCSLCDGTDWNQVINTGFDNIQNWGVLSLIVLGNDLYGVAANDETGIEVWRTNDGDSWEQVGFNGFGDKNNYRPYWDNSVVVFDDSLYIGTYNYVSGGELWRKSDFIQAVIDPETGGTITHTDPNSTTISIPPGAVTETIMLLYTDVLTALAPPGFSFAGHVFNLDAHIDGLLLPNYSFLKPISVTIYYSDTDVAGLDESSLILDYWNGSIWVDAACGGYDRHLDENWLSVPICHLSEFGLFGYQTHYICLPLIVR